MFFHYVPDLPPHLILVNTTRKDGHIMVCQHGYVADFQCVMKKWPSYTEREPLLNMPSRRRLFSLSISLFSIDLR